MSSGQLLKLSFPRRRESSDDRAALNSRLHGNDGAAEVTS
jgi:hypothetical protein